MRLILIGCEYTGKTTLAIEFSKWMIRTMGLEFVRWHNHFVVPHVDTHLVVSGTQKDSSADLGIGKSDQDMHTPADKEQMLGLRPSLLEQFQRQMIWHHLHQAMYKGGKDVLMIDAWYADAVYAPLYYGYGHPGSFADRNQRAREWDRQLLTVAPDTILVLLHASQKVIHQRIEMGIHSKSILKQNDIETVLEGFCEQYHASLIGNKFSLETSDRSIDQTFDEFMTNIAPYI